MEKKNPCTLLVELEIGAANFYCVENSMESPQKEKKIGTTI